MSRALSGPGGRYSRGGCDCGVLLRALRASSVSCSLVQVEELMADVTRAMDKRGGVPLAQHDASEASGAPPVLV